MRKDTEPPFEVSEYSFDSLKSLLAEKSLPRPVLQSGAEFGETLSDQKPHITNAKHHCKFLEHFFQKQGVSPKTILSENRYVDFDYIKDHADHYSRCFRRYNRHCVRLHFFSKSFNKANFEELLSNNENSSITAQELQDSYLGFIVVKPLPKTLIGRTCLTPIKNNELHCSFPATRKYEIGLFGIELSLNSLAFQEQDNVVSACATSALWSMFHKTGMLFQHSVPSPAEITRVARGTDIGALNKGLTQIQVNRAIRSVNLAPLVLVPEHRFEFLTLTYAYLSFGIPIFMAHQLFEMTVNQEGDEKQVTDVKMLGGHASTLVGYGMSNEPISQVINIENGEAVEGEKVEGEKVEIYLRSSRLKEIYAHDDQVGPFTKYSLSENHVMTHPDPDSEKGKKWSIPSHYPSSQKENTYVRATELELHIPLYSKIRIDFKLIYKIVIKLNYYIDCIRKSTAEDHSFSKHIEWDIRLVSVNELKDDIRLKRKPIFPHKKDILLLSMPKYIWRCSGKDLDGNDILDLLFDATDIEQGIWLLTCVCYEKELCNLLTESSKYLLAAMRDGSGSAMNSVISELWQVFSWFARKSKREHAM